MGHEVTLACLDYPRLGPALEAPGVRLVSVKGDLFAVRGRGWSPKFRNVVMEEAAKADIVHNHGLWMWPNAYAREAALASGKPLVISPRGMLEAWSLNRSKLRKAIAWRLFEKRNLQSAAMFHATAESEAESIRQVVLPVWRVTGDEWQEEKPACAGSDFRLRSAAAREAGVAGEDVRLADLKLETFGGVPIVVAPNGVDLPDLSATPPRELLEVKFPRLKDRRWVVFMSRLHPKKGIDVLLRAWARQKEVARGDWRAEARATGTPFHRGAVLVLAGPDLTGYRKDVERMVRELGLEDLVVITGEVQGQTKDCLLANADVFVLPSYSENFGIVVAEAMAWGRPVIASTGTPWQEIAECGAGWWVKPEEGALAEALREALGKRREEIGAMGARGRMLVEERYTWAAPAEKLVGAYKEILATAFQGL